MAGQPAGRLGRQMADGFVASWPHICLWLAAQPAG
jgi:hypothetical protein